MTFGISDPDVVGSGRPLVVWGLASDDIDRVSVLTSNGPVAATLSGNLYTWIGSADMEFSSVRGVVGYLVDGRTVTLGFRSPF
jgi:hypothetical protein